MLVEEKVTEAAENISDITRTDPSLEGDGVDIKLPSSKPEVGDHDETMVGVDSEHELDTGDDWGDDWSNDELGPSLAEELEAAARSVQDAALENEPDTDEQINPHKDVAADRDWYVVHCYSGYENKVRHNLEQRTESMEMQHQIFDVVVPTEDEVEVREGKRKTVERRVFPGYILVQMKMSEESWYVVRNTPGVTGFVGVGNTPSPLPETEVATIMSRMEADAPRIRVSFKTDQKVRIVDGPFNDFIGTVSNIDMDRTKVRVMVSFFGRETPVELDFLQVETT